MSDRSLEVPGSHWHVTVTVNGSPAPTVRLRECLDALAIAYPFGFAARYQPDLVEIRFWDEGQDCATVTSRALELWPRHSSPCGLPSWPVIGLEVVDRSTFRRRWPRGAPAGHLLQPGVRPFAASRF